MKNISKKEMLMILPFAVFFIVLTLLVSGNGFFWDTILLASKYAHWFTENNFNSFILPQELDAIHPPTFGLYIALCWLFFGKTLMVSHIGMLPFLLGIVWQTYLIGKYYFRKEHLFFVMLFVLADTTLLGQSTLVSPDIAMLFFFLLSVTSVLHKNRSLLFIGIISMSFISVRGMFAALVIFCYDIWMNSSSISIRSLFKTALSRLTDYIPAFILVLSYLFFRFKSLGYLIPPVSDNWSGHYDTTGIKGILYNTGILGWRLVDFGRIFIYLFLVAFVINYFRKRLVTDKKLIQLTGFFLLFLLINSPYLLFFQQPILHRYLMAANVFCSLIFLYIIFETGINKYLSRWIYAIALLGLLSGNFWIYPDHIAKGWDSTLAHLPYYNIRNEIIRFIEQEKISFDAVGTEFPNTAAFEYIDLNGKQTSFTEKNMQQPYIFYSNIFNDFSKQELMELKNNWVVIKKIENRGVKGILYKKNNVN
jgi:hypothetical protein